MFVEMEIRKKQSGIKKILKINKLLGEGMCGKGVATLN